MGTKTVDTSQIFVGDVVRNHGMRIRIDEIKTYSSGDHAASAGGATVYACLGTVLNLDEVREAGVVPMSWLYTEKWVNGKGWTTDRNDLWNVQGNKLATWQVEVTEPAPES